MGFINQLVSGWSPPVLAERQHMQSAFGEQSKRLALSLCTCRRCSQMFTSAKRFSTTHHHDNYNLTRMITQSQRIQLIQPDDPDDSPSFPDWSWLVQKWLCGYAPKSNDNNMTTNSPCSKAGILGVLHMDKHLGSFPSWLVPTPATLP